MVVLNKRSKGGKGVERVDDEELYNGIMDEISSGDIQSTMDKLLENQSFDFGDFVGKTINSGKGIDFNNILKQIADGIVSNLNDEKSLYTNIILIALSGAVITNFSKLLQGKRVAQMGFYTIYVLFFSVLSVSFMRTSTIAEETLTKIFDFMKVLAPTYFTCLSFTKGAGLGTGYYQITLLMLTVADFILLKFVLPGVKIYFWLRIADQLSEEEMFSKMAEFVKDILSFSMKTMSVVLMGVNVVQGMIAPLAAEAKNSALVKVGSMVPGIGNTISSAASSVLLAGSLVKNAVGVAGIVVLIIICAMPLIRLWVSEFAYKGLSAVLQPVSDKRIIKCLSMTSDAIKLLAYAVGLAAMFFAISIAVISTMTN